MLKTRKIGIIGFGALGRQIYDYLIRYEKDNLEFVFFDDLYSQIGETIYPFSFYKNEEFRNLEFIVGLGYKHLNVKCQIIDWLRSNNRNLINFIHPSAIIEPNVKIGQGIVIYPGTIVEHGSEIGDGVILNVGSTVCHDSRIGNSTFVAPRVCVLGNCTVGKSCFIGANTTITNNITIGDNCIIGQASSVTRNLGDKVSAIGSPLQIKDIELR